VSILGESRAFDEVLIATSLSLMFKRPQEVYTDVLAELLKLTSYEIKRDIMGVCRYVAGELVTRRGHAPIGSSAEVLEQAEDGTLQPHPIYREIAIMLDKNATRVSSLSLLACPASMDDTAASDALRPMVFRDGTILPERLHHLREDADVFLAIAALVCSIANKESVCPRFGCII
jgi:hypothetical protein